MTMTGLSLGSGPSEGTGMKTPTSPGPGAAPARSPRSGCSACSTGGPPARAPGCGCAPCSSIYDLEDLLRLRRAVVDLRGRRPRSPASSRTRPDARVFEWGSGASTLWLSRRAGSVTSHRARRRLGRRIARAGAARPTPTCTLVVAEPAPARPGGSSRQGRASRGSTSATTSTAIDRVDGELRPRRGRRPGPQRLLRPGPGPARRRRADPGLRQRRPGRATATRSGARPRLRVTSSGPAG